MTVPGGRNLRTCVSPGRSPFVFKCTEPSHSESSSWFSMSESISSKLLSSLSSRSGFLLVALPLRTNLSNADSAKKTYHGYHTGSFNFDSLKRKQSIRYFQLSRELVWKCFRNGIISQLQKWIHCPTSWLTPMFPLTKSEIRCPSNWSAEPGRSNANQGGQAFGTNFHLQENTLGTPFPTSCR